VIDSNVFEPGSTWEIRAMPRADGSSVEMLLQRGFRRGPKGRLGSALNHTIGKWGLWSSYLRHALREIEKHAPKRPCRTSRPPCSDPETRNPFARSASIVACLVCGALVGCSASLAD